MPQALFASTQIFPVLLPKFTMMLVPPCPEASAAPDGTVQIYEVTPDTGDMPYATLFCPEQTVSAPLMIPGVAGSETTVI